MMFNATLNNISVISWWLALLVEKPEYPKKTTDLPQVTEWQTLSHNLKGLFWFYGVLRYFQQYFSYIVVISFIGGETGVPRENHRPATRHWQTLSHNVLRITLIGIKTHKLVVIGTDCIGSCIAIFHTFTTSKAPISCKSKILISLRLDFRRMKIQTENFFGILQIHNHEYYFLNFGFVTVI